MTARRSTRTKVVLTTTVIIISALSLVVAAVVWATTMTWFCDENWPDHDNRWSIGAGCQVLSEEGWIPDYRFRVFD